RAAVVQESADPAFAVNSPWQAVATYDRSWAPDLHGADARFFQSYVSSEQRVDLCWAIYSGSHGFELVSPYNRVISPKSWSVVSDSSAPAVVDGKPIRVHSNLILGEAA